MTHPRRARTTPRAATARALVVCVLAVGALTGCAAIAQEADAAPASAEEDVDAGHLRDGQVGPEDGAVPDDASPFDTDLPAIAHLDPALLQAVQQAARDAADDGITFIVTTGWRSPAFQQHLLDLAVQKYGSEPEARRYVATPQTSRHVTGTAIDIGPTDADSWLSQHGVDYGLCQTYANEMWHFELATTPGGQCPVMLTDASAG